MEGKDEVILLPPDPSSLTQLEHTVQYINVFADIIERPRYHCSVVLESYLIRRILLSVNKKVKTSDLKTSVPVRRKIPNTPWTGYGETTEDDHRPLGTTGKGRPT